MGGDFLACLLEPDFVWDLSPCSLKRLNQIRKPSNPSFPKVLTGLWLHTAQDSLLNCISATTRIKFRECYRDGSTIEVLSCAPLTHAVPPDPYMLCGGVLKSGKQAEYCLNVMQLNKVN